MIDYYLVSYVNSDVIYVGGIMECKKIVSMVVVHFIDVVLYNV